MTVFDMSKSMNAFAQGAAIGGSYRQSQTDKKLAPMVAAGDYQGAAQYAGQRGDLQGAELYRTQYMEALKAATEEDRLKDKQRRQGIASIAMGGMNVPEEYLPLYVQENAGKLKEYGIPDEQIAQWSLPGTLNRQALDGFVREAMDFDQQVETYLAQTKPVEGKAINNRLVNPFTAEVMGDYSDAEGPLSTMGKLQADLQAGLITPEQYQMEIGRMRRSGVNVNVNTGANGPEIGTIPQGYAAVLDPSNPSGYRLEAIPGGEAAAGIAAEREKREKNLGGTELTVGNLIGAYSTLAGNKAITSQGNDASGNLAAIYSRSPIGKFQDEIGGGVGNLANAEARQTIDGLSMNALMKMISMSDVSAKAMDSDAEMRAWLSAIKSDNYEAALTKLHVLDVSFGKGTALQEAYANGTIDLPTYQRVTRRLNSDPMTKQMYDKAQRYSQLGQAVGASNLTGNEQQAIQDLSGASDDDLFRMMTGGQ